MRFLITRDESTTLIGLLALVLAMILDPDPPRWG